MTEITGRAVKVDTSYNGYGDVLLCPVCDFEYTHLENTAMAARQREDGNITHVSVDSCGDVSHPAWLMVGEAVGEGRRQRIVVEGSCENGHSFGIVFTQHKGITIVESVSLPMAKANNEPDAERLLLDPVDLEAIEALGRLS